MAFKTVAELKREIESETASLTLDEFREDVARTIKDNVKFGERQIDHYCPLGTNTDFLNTICSELKQFGYKAQIGKGNSEARYVLLRIEY